MSRAGRLTPFSYVILALVGRDGAGPHDIVRMMREGAIFWTTSESHYYAEPRRLATLGFLRARTEPGRTRPRTHYELTDAGREALTAWLAEPVGLPRVQNEAMVKLLARSTTVFSAPQYLFRNVWAQTKISGWLPRYTA